MNNNKLFAFITVLICISSGLIGCSSPASKDGIVAHDILNIKHHPNTVLVKAQGGSETGAMDSSNISNKDFAQAIEESIIESKLFTRVIHGEGSDYLLNVTIVSMSKPMFGASFTVSMEAAWSLSDAASKEAVLRKSIKSSHTVTMGQALIGTTRLRLAVEGAARKNIQLGLEAISELQLK